ncbi:hypothetical protein SASPL_119835 [Salvia splendens]|uniref:Uncharacterized protein n=1 Tax=Salvia splendens TaxID=180675 RepID=A0A8X8XP22_SALSN|nr:uncharacterized protein LOC121811426 [Salvia splendens]KAG6417651.1 hypothetical protein SASPL_119835 [Salvia splendens]
MDLQRSLLLNFTYFQQDKSMDEARESLLLTMELEDTRLQAQEELKARDQQISHLKELLSAAIRDRDEAHDKCHKLMLLLQRQSTTPHSSIEDRNNNASDCDESIVSSPPPEQDLAVLIDHRPLPEKGKFLQAVMKAGPLLQTLLLAGPLPQWRHPPPPLDSYQIPPPPLSALNHDGNCRKRGASEMSHDDALKYQRIVLQ